MGEIHKYMLKESWYEAPDVKIFRFEPLERKVEFLPGQFVFIHILEHGKTIVKRPMSAASDPAEREIEFCIKMVGGELTGRLEKMREGDEIGIEKGGGVLAYKGQKRIGLISGGTGIAPMISILRTAIKGDTDIIFFHSAKDKEHLLYKKELEKAAEKAKIVITLTRESWDGGNKFVCEEGRLDKEKIAKHSDIERSWFVCGPLGLCKAMKEALLELGAKREEIRVEGWG